jgi:hypothetical protein
MWTALTSIQVPHAFEGTALERQDFVETSSGVINGDVLQFSSISVNKYQPIIDTAVLAIIYGKGITFTQSLVKHPTVYFTEYSPSPYLPEFCILGSVPFSIVQTFSGMEKTSDLAPFLVAQEIAINGTVLPNDQDYVLSPNDEVEQTIVGLGINTATQVTYSYKVATLPLLSPGIYNAITYRGQTYPRTFAFNGKGFVERNNSVLLCTTI